MRGRRRPHINTELMNVVLSVKEIGVLYEAMACLTSSKIEC